MVDYQVVFASVGFLIAVYGFYNTLKHNAIKQATDIDLLKLEIKHLKEISDLHGRRLDDHDDQNKALVALTEQIKSLKVTVHDIKNEMMRKGNDK